MDNSELAAEDLRYLWHPCTQMKDHEWLPLVPIRRGQGVWLEDFDDDDEDEAGDDVRPFYGEGDRQYLTGLRVGGERILVNELFLPRIGEFRR